MLADTLHVTQFGALANKSKQCSLLSPSWATVLGVPFCSDLGHGQGLAPAGTAGQGLQPHSDDVPGWAHLVEGSVLCMQGHWQPP